MLMKKDNSARTFCAEKARNDRVHRCWRCVDIPVMDYQEALKLQHQLVAARKSGRIETDMVLMLEHPSAFTLGRRGGEENLAVPRKFLAEKHIPVIQAERGGDITYHGPGQIVVYPIVRLDTIRLNVSDYVFKMEEVMIRTVRKWGIEAKRNVKNPGVWVDGRKLGSLGIAIRRGISFHGFALNIDVSLEPFSWINPCGLKGTQMTSMENQLNHRVPINKVRQTLKHHIETVFGVGLERMHPSELENIKK